MAYVCLCNSFNEGTLEAAIDDMLPPEDGASVKLSDVYKRCSGGEKPQCGKCLQQIKASIQARQDVNTGNSAAEDSIPVVNLPTPANDS